MERAEQLKREAQEQVATHRGELEELSLRIHGNPELSLEEENSSRWLAEYLAGKGFDVTKPAYGLPTAFEAVYGEGNPSIGIIAEYDALPGIGHACGHNIIATAAVGAGLAAKVAADAFGATIRVIGTAGGGGPRGEDPDGGQRGFQERRRGDDGASGGLQHVGLRGDGSGDTFGRISRKSVACGGRATPGRERAGGDDYFVQRHQLASSARGGREPGARDHHGRRSGGERGAGPQRRAVLHPSPRTMFTWRR